MKKWAKSRSADPVVVICNIVSFFEAHPSVSRAAVAAGGPLRQLRARRPSFLRASDTIMTLAAEAMMPFETYATLLNLKKVLPSSKSNYVAVDRDYWIASIYPRLSEIELDENWYLARYPDVAEAVAKGVVASARLHYCQSGYFEHRLPYKIEVNANWYLNQYSDVQAAIAHNIYGSAQEHFEQIGFREGRCPYAGFALRRNGEAAAGRG